ncbi:hypothetical protein [Streptomyces sp. ME19-01-6]|uniref:hypothetical protein n=1 Tax=Streptomyces sp. ME19-01-6 TaxID=3028686 RepID=UPI0029A5268C|nr:hypothetical protein [Streptomyces sp. ME19-01-6]MDX3226091.1 hypothetical protein [Streptomyces sp. ME19-01-6]
MIRRILARRRLEIRYHAAWCSHPIGKRPIGPRPMVGLHRLPDPDCSTCEGDGYVMTGSAYDPEEPDFEGCDCAPFLPLVTLWLPKWSDTTRVRRRNRPGYSDEPPF